MRGSRLSGASLRAARRPGDALDKSRFGPYLAPTLISKDAKYKMPDPLSMTLAALADPTRRAILARLSQGEATVNELAEPFEISLPSISRHLKVLEGAGLITRGRQAQWRPCKLETRPLKEVDGWLERYRKFWTGSFDRMDALLNELTRAPAKRRKQ
jgi:DNA-binding transcriptional ArsR family regulator